MSCRESVSQAEAVFEEPSIREDRMFMAVAASALVGNPEGSRLRGVACKVMSFSCWAAWLMGYSRCVLQERPYFRHSLGDVGIKLRIWLANPGCEM